MITDPPRAGRHVTHALIIIDMQRGSFTPATPKHDADGLVARLNRLAETVRTVCGTVIFIQHDGPPGDPHHPDLPGWHLLAGLQVRDAERLLVLLTLNNGRVMQRHRYALVEARLCDLAIAKRRS